MATKTTAQNRSHWLVWILAGIAFLLYANTLSYGFVLDDQAVVTQNRFVQKGLAGWPDIFSHFYWQGYWNQNAGLYRPLSVAMFAAEWQFLPDNPLIHHFFNVAIYALIVVCLFKLLKKLLPAANDYFIFFSVLLFAVHPTHTEAVANIKGRDELLCFLFFLGSAWLMLNEKLKGALYFLAASGTFALCLLSKEAGITFIPVFFLALYLFRPAPLKEQLMRCLPFVITTVLWLGLRHWVTHYNSPPLMDLTYRDNSTIACDGTLERMATGVSILGRYLLKCFIPYPLSYDYSFNEIPCVGLLNPMVLATVLVCAALIYWAFREQKRFPLLLFGTAFFFFTIAISSNILFPIGTTMGDRLLFTPVLGMILPVTGWLYRKAPAKGFADMRSLLLAALCCVFALFSFNRNKAWKSNDTLFTADVTHAPNSARVHYNYATKLLGHVTGNIDNDRKLYDKIIPALERSLELDPKEPGTYVNLGVAYYKTGDYVRSAAMSRGALRITPGDYAVYINLADALVHTGQADSALYYYKGALEHGQSEKNIYNNMGSIYFAKQQLSEAVAILAEGVKRFPEFDEMWMNYGSALAQSGHLRESILPFETAYRLNSNRRQALYFLAITYQNLGDKENADKYMKLYQSNPQ